MCPDVHKKGDKPSENVVVCARNKTTTLLQTLIVSITHNGKVETLRCLLDGGSQRSYVKAAVIKKLGLQSTGTERICHTLFGGVEQPAEVYKCFDLLVSSVDNSFSIRINALQQTELCGHLPKIQDVTLLKKLRDLNIKISDLDSADTEISLLIGSDYLGSIITNQLVHLDNNLMAVKTNFGWTLQGPIQVKSIVNTSISCFSKTNLEDLWSVELLGIKDPFEKQCKKKNETEILSVFNNNISVNAQGRYEVSLLWKEGRPELNTNHEVACKRLESTTKKLKSTESKTIMAEGMFDLRGWVAAPHRIDNTIAVSVLGLSWDTSQDDLRCMIDINETIPEKITKRYVMSVMQRVFDPLGFVCPATLVPKLIMQKVWEHKIDWDQAIPTQLAQDFKNWLKTVSQINQCRIPRRISTMPIEKCETSLHVFCDASQASYASCLYLRTQQDEKVQVQLIMAKNRVAPANKKMSLPRLELMGALIGSRLYKEVLETGLLKNCKSYKVYFWTDSAVTLAWIKRQAQWKAFVSNRVKEICTTTNCNDWHHLPGEYNPADLPSRGCSAQKLLESKWWEGPAWLKYNNEDWPKSNIDCNEELVKEEISQNYAVNVDVIEQPFSKRLMYFSKYNKIVRLVAWILRLSYNVRRKYNVHQANITNDEYINAEKTLFKLLQKENFTTGKVPKNINTKLDDEGILRVKTRLELSQESAEFVNPILLPGKNEIVQRLVIQRHEKHCHAGTQFLLSNFRNGFWILNMRRLVKGVVSRCIICKRSKSKHYEVPEAPLPPERIEASTPFQVTGIDLAGPLFLRDQGKCWIALFTCATYRAVHLELLESLSASSMLMALRRFIARRGRINVIFTDNGGNFQGCSNSLKEVDWAEVEAATVAGLTPIKWRFIPPRAPWWGGWWERLIKVVKEMLRRILGKQSVTWIELSTILCDCEAVINNRPLTYVATDDDSLRPLTPMMFLQALPSSEVPDLDQIDSKTLNIRFRYLQKLRNDFRERFRNEYISLICSKHRCNPSTPKVNDIVLIETDSSRLYWPLGIIKDLFTGTDGHSRVAKVQTATGEWVRAVQKLYPLELTTVTDEWRDQEDRGRPETVRRVSTDAIFGSDLDRTDDPQPCINKMMSRHGRAIKIPQRFLD